MTVNGIRIGWSNVLMFRVAAGGLDSSSPYNMRFSRAAST